MNKLNIKPININDIKIGTTRYLFKVFGEWYAGTFSLRSDGEKFFTGYGDSYAKLDWLDKDGYELVDITLPTTVG